VPVKPTLHFASDHAAVDLRSVLQTAAEGWGFAVVDHGPATVESIDYPLQATKVAHALADDPQALGVLVCGTGIGMSMVANRFGHLRAAAVSDTFSAAATRQHNDANVLCLGARTVGPAVAEACLKTFVETAFEGGRHSRRVALFPPGFQIEE
jgi:ribose 5-phosphate isomerase B